MSPIRLHLAGRPRLQPAAGEPFALERKDAAWLAVLALEGPFARDTLAAWLWPEVARKTANTSLRQRIFRLRKRAGHDLVQAAETVALLPDVTVADEEGATELLAGLEYADCPDFADWLRRRRDLWRARRVDALAAAAARHEAAGELAAALEQVHALLALEPLSEHAQRRLMRLHYLRGDRAAAIAAFERFERALKDELGTRPDPETLALLATVEAAAPAAAPRAAVVPAALQRPPRLVGRARELAALHQAWASGRVFLLLGEAGMGKSRLLAELAVAPGRELVQVAARPGDAGVPFALLARLLRAVRERREAGPDPALRRELARVLPELGGGSAPAGEGQRLLLQRAVEWQLAALGDAGVLLDDLHFADAANLEMLQALVAAESLPRLQWGLAQRPAEGGPAAAALRDGLAEGQRLHEVPLAPLDEAAMRELVESLALPGLDAAALAPALVRHTGGNPLFALETLKDLVLHDAGDGTLPQPASVGALIERRLKSLSAPALALARVAAVAGVDFGIELAEAVLKTPALGLADAWGELQAAQVLAGSAFAHDLVFEATLRTLPAEIARHVHASVASVLEARRAEPARVAEHWYAAQRWREAAPHFMRAGEDAKRAGQVSDALDLHARAARCWREAGDEAAACDSEIESLDHELVVRGVAAATGSALRLSRAAPTDGLRARALARLALVQVFGARWQDARHNAEEALRLGGAQAPLNLRLEAVRARASAQAQLGQAGDAVATIEALLPEVERDGDARQRMELRSTQSYVLRMAGRLYASAAALRAGLALAEAMGDAAETLTLLGNLAAVEGQIGYMASAARRLRAAMLLSDRVGAGSGPTMTTFAVNLGWMALHLGELGEALARLEEAPARMAPIGAQWQAVAANHLASFWLELGQPHRARAALEGTPEHPAARLRRCVLLARAARAQGEDVAARLQAELEGAPADAPPRELAVLKLELSRVAPTTRALALVREVRHDARQAELPGLDLHALMREVDLLRAVDPGHAAELARELADFDPEVCPDGGYWPETAWVRAQEARDRGDAAGCARAVEQGHAWIERAAATLPAGLRSGFLERNPVNAALLKSRAITRQ